MPVVEKIEIVEQNVGVESIDLLNRQPFVNQLINVANMLADNKKMLVTQLMVVGALVKLMF